MKPIDSKDKPKLYALIALTVCVLGYAAFSGTAGVGSTPPTPAPGTAAKPAPPAAASVTTGTTATRSAGTATASADPNSPVPVEVAAMVTAMGPPMGGRDPFTPTGPAAKGTITVSPTAHPPRIVGTTPSPAVNNGLEPLLGLDKIRKSQTPPSFGMTEVPSMEVPRPVVLPPPPVPEVVVTGVVMSSEGDAQGVAILRGKDAKGGDERRFVSTGDYVGNGFSVASVHADGVDLRDKAGNRRVTLKIGQKENSRAN